jgi:hypothetical protein
MCTGDAPATGTGDDSPSGGGVPRRPARLARRHGRPATVHVTLAYTTLAGLDDHPARLEGYGPIPAEAGRRIAADATLRRILTDPATGALHDYGRTTYQPPRSLAALVIARDPTCRFPTCDAPAATSDLDHAQPWNAGGTTSAANLHALSRRCHTEKTHHGWTIDRLPSGGTAWTSPAGHHHQSPPEPIHTVRDLPGPDPDHDPPPF